MIISCITNSFRQKDPNMNACWIVYTNDTRFPSMRLDSVFTDEDNANLRVTLLNEDDRSRGVSADVRQSHAVRFNLYSEPYID